MLFGLYRFAVTGQLSTPGRNFGPASSTVYFSEHPVWFLVLSERDSRKQSFKAERLVTSNTEADAGAIFRYSQVQQTH